MTYIAAIHDVETGEIIERPYTADEIKQAEKDAKDAAALNAANATAQAAAAEAATKRDAILAALAAAAGLSIDEVKSALGA